jgi:predicted ATPase/class 3 adenylate cyclase
VATIRRELGEGGRDAIESRSGGYRLRSDRATTDLAEFERLCEMGVARSGPAEQAGALSDALALWRGDPVQDLAARGFAHPAMVELSERRLATVEALADAELDLARPAAVLGLLERLAQEHPYREGLTARLARALYSSGRQTDALRVLRRLRIGLRDDVGVEPGPAIADLERAILGHDPALRTAPPERRQDLPSGVVTFVFTDIVGSTARWERDAAAMGADLERHDEICSRAISAGGGAVVKTVGDSFMAVFEEPTAALDAAARLQRALVDQAWLADDQLRVRIGVHTGAAFPRDGDYHGPAVNIAARLVHAGHGGQVVVSGVTVQLAQLGSDLGTRVLGRYELRGISESVEVHQLVAPGLARTFPPLHAVRAGSAVPRQVTPFVGRRSEVADVRRLLGTYRVVTVVGAGGMGKTRLAIEAAELTAADGAAVHFADLAPRVGTAAVVEEICRGAGLTEVSGDPVEALVVRLSRQDTLMVIDNCEHAVADVSRMIDRLVAACSALHVLATSRVPLGVDGECRYALRPMPPEEDASELLRQRAREAGCVEPVDDVAGARLCRLLDGMPLAIELAAPWLRVLGPRELAVKIERDQTLIDEPLRGTAAKTMGQIIRWSLSLLDAATVATLCGLCEFPAGFTFEQAERFLGDEPTRTLGTLTDASLLRSTDSVTERRHRILEPVRAFGIADARRRGDRVDSQRRQARVMLDVVRPIARGLTTRQEATWRRRLEEELPNLAAAVGWAAQDDPALAVAIVSPLAPLVSFLPAGAARLALPIVDEVAPEQLHDGLAVVALAMFARSYLDANPAGLELVADVRSAVDDRGGDVEACVLMYLGTVSTVLGDPITAIQWYSRAAEQGRRADDAVVIAEAAMLQAAWCWFAQQPGHEGPLAESTALAAELGGPSLVSLCDVVSGLFTVDDQPDVAEEHFRRALSVGAPTGYGPGVAEFMLGLVHARRGDRRGALGLARASLQRFVAAGLQIEVGMALSGLTAILLAIGEDDHAGFAADVVRNHFAPVAAMPGFARYLDQAAGPGVRTASRAPGARNADINEVVALVVGLLDVATNP